jgi:hypothetical protein
MPETKEEIKFSEKVEIPQKVIKNNELILERSDLPIIINFEGVTKYILIDTKGGKLRIDRKHD